MEIHEKLDKLSDIVLDPKFQEKLGFGNDVPYRIFDYDPKDELIVRKHLEYILDKNGHFKEFDLFEIIIKILQEDNVLEKYMMLQERLGNERLLSALSSALELNTSQNRIVEYFKNNVNKGDVIFLTGIGKAYPIIRTHSVLSHLQVSHSDNILIAMYPGKFTGTSLSLFGIIEDSNYYRAFRIIKDN
ncbi:MAG: hypothetical protein FD133_370 [Erysipelotrichaceae bacterium]|nr:MAG: hypothetical protein FD133_370 [Erysipelotrichaceae bacterium]